jgi:purine catabolism regulator
MSTRLAELIGDPALGLRLLTGSDTVAVGWAHSSDLTDPTPFLEAENLLLTTGTQFADDDPPATYQDYVARLVSVGVSAVGFGTEVVRSGTPEPLVDACAERELPLVEVPFRTPFLAVVRRIADAQAALEHARDIWALEAQRSISLAALSRDRIVAVLDELARRLDAAVVLLDPHGEETSTHGPRRLGAADLAAIATEAKRLLRRRLRSGSALEVTGLVINLQTLGRRHELRGVLAVATESRPDQAATAVITSAVALAEFAVEDAARQQESRLTLNGELLELAGSGGLDPARRVLAVGGRRLPEAPLRVLQTRLGPDGEQGELEHVLSVRAAADGNAVLAARWRDGFVAVVELAAVPAATELLVARNPPVVVSRPVDWTGVGGALRDGRSELDRVGPDRDRPHDVIDLGIDPLLGLLARADVAAAAERQLRPLMADPDGQELRRAVETWLRHNAAWDPAARELGIHRHTLKAQVRRAGDLLDLDLDTFGAKVELFLLVSS